VIWKGPAWGRSGLETTLVVWKLDRLGRSVKGLVDLVTQLETRDVDFESLTDGIDTKTPTGRFFFQSWPASPRWSASS
jgi:DNA invertase Pin-like site-specific DNA recombinase